MIVLSDVGAPVGRGGSRSFSPSGGGGGRMTPAGRGGRAFSPGPSPMAPGAGRAARAFGPIGPGPVAPIGPKPKGPLKKGFLPMGPGPKKPKGPPPPVPAGVWHHHRWWWRGGNWWWGPEYIIVGGVCMPYADCPDTYNPVLATDGLIYDNECWVLLAGERVVRYVSGGEVSDAFDPMIEQRPLVEVVNEILDEVQKAQSAQKDNNNTATIMALNKALAAATIAAAAAKKQATSHWYTSGRFWAGAVVGSGLLATAYVIAKGR